MRVLLIATLLLFFSSWPLAAQGTDGLSEAARVDAILAGGAITTDQAAWLVGRSTELLDESASPDDAAKLAVSRWGLAETAPNTPLTADTYAQLLMAAEGLSGGFFYTLFPGPRYAFRELIYLRIFPPGLQPGTQLSGADAMLYLQNTQTWKEAHP